MRSALGQAAKLSLVMFAASPSILGVSTAYLSLLLLVTWVPSPISILIGGAVVGDNRRQKIYNKGNKTGEIDGNVIEIGGKILELDSNVVKIGGKVMRIGGNRGVLNDRWMEIGVRATISCIE